MVTAQELDALLTVARKHGTEELDMTFPMTTWPPGLDTRGLPDSFKAARLRVKFAPTAPAPAKEQKDEPEPRRALDLLGDFVAGTDRVEYPPGADPGAPASPAGSVGWATDNPAKEK